MPKTWTDNDLIREALKAEAKRRRELSDRLLKDKARNDSSVKVRPSQIVALQTTAIRLEELSLNQHFIVDLEDDALPEVEDEALPISTFEDEEFEDDE